MAIRDVFKVSRKTFFNPSAWFGFDSFKMNTQTLWESVRGITAPIQPGKEETFSEAMNRLKLTEEDIKRTKESYFAYAIFFAVIGLLLIAFSFYLLIHHGTFHGWLLSLVAAAFSFSQAFRFHFWYFQLKHRKLGCTFEEWRHGKPFDKGTKA